MIDLCIPDRLSEINLLEHIAKLKRPAVRTYFITLSRLVSLMITAPGFFQLPKNFFEAFSSDALFCFRSDLYFILSLIVGDIASILKIINKIAHAIFFVRQFILSIKLIEPLQCFANITICISQ